MSTVSKFFLTQLLLHKIPYGSIVGRPEQAPAPTRVAPPDFVLNSAEQPLDRGDSLGGSAEDNSNSTCEGCSLIEVLGHCVQQMVLFLALFYFINLVGVLQVMLWVPFHLLCTIATAPTASHALRQNTAYMKRVLVMNTLSNVIHLLLKTYVLAHLFRLLPMQQIEQAIYSIIPECVVDLHNRFSDGAKSYFE